MFRFLSLVSVAAVVVGLLWGALFLGVLLLVALAFMVVLPVRFHQWWNRPEQRRYRKELAQREAARENPGALGPDWLPPIVATRREKTL